MSFFPRWRLLAALLLTLALVTAGPVAPIAAQDGPDDTTTTSSTVPTTELTTTTTSAPATTTTSPGGASTTSTPDDDEEPDDPDATTTTLDPDDEGPDTELPGPGPGSGLPYDPSELAEILAGYDEAVADHAELLAQFELSVSQLDELNASMVDLSDRIAAVEEELLEAQTELTVANNRLNTAEIRLVDVERDLAAAKVLLEEQAIDAYIYGGSNAGFYAILNAESIDEIETSRQYAQAVIEDTDATIGDYARLELEAERFRAEAEDAATDATDARDEVEARREVLEAEREARARAQADAFIAALAQKGLIDQVEAQRGTYEDRIRGLRGSSDSINTALKAAQEDHDLPFETDRTLLPPVQNPTTTSPYGPRLHPIFGTVRMHNGLDINAAMGQPVRASAAGTVVIAGWQGGYGNTIVIDHGNGIGTLYAHNSSLVVTEGDEVEMGDVTALAGSTGWSTGPHVHWEVRVFGNPTDPLPFMGGEALLDAQVTSTTSTPPTTSRTPTTSTTSTAPTIPSSTSTTPVDE